MALDALGFIRDASPTPGRRLLVELGELTVDLTAHEALVAFVAARFATRPASDDVDVDVVSHIHAHCVDVVGRPGGRRVWKGADNALWCTSFPSMPSLTVRFTDHVPLFVETWLDQSAFRQAYRRLAAGVTRAARLEELTAYGVVYPALLAADARGRFPLHASAIVRDGRAVVIAGPPGSGKSTLVAALAGQGYAVFSDNLVLVARDGLWSLPEPLKLDERSRRLAGCVNSAAARSTYGRTAERLEAVRGPVEPVALLLVDRGETGGLKELGRLDMDLLTELNRLALELHVYYFYRALSRLMLPPSAGEQETLTAGLAGARVARLAVAEGSIEDAVAAVSGLL